MCSVSKTQNYVSQNGCGLDQKKHWEKTYSAQKPGQHSWYQVGPKVSLALIAATGVRPDAALLDVGGGDSTLADALLDQHFSRLTVLDIAASALARAKARLGEESSNNVHWVEADITTFRTTERFALWHDRAVFHFLTEAQDRALYRETLHTCLPLGGHLILAAFALDGPTQCSNLDVIRYDANTLQAALGCGVELLETCQERHVTPTGKEQTFVYARFRRC